ncbi:rRNA methyltransferase 1, mitochondrial-like [Anneissia japonica]|uniref:rRNA methyltransferase 1, mitochondrial-like n=1 Tax=Anneissia japonica TaxID=1529436 RepID=UPI001425A835|nr:rRNA methyltransferase 1, mitochondrial-like [Anneissia japonica]
MILKLMPSLKFLGLAARLLQQHGRLTACIATSSVVHTPPRWAKTRPRPHQYRAVNSLIEEEIDRLSPVTNSKTNKEHLYSEEYDINDGKCQKEKEFNVELNRPNSRLFLGNKPKGALIQNKELVYTEDVCASDSQHFKENKAGHLQGLPQRIRKPAERMKVILNKSKVKQWKSDGDRMRDDGQRWKAMPSAKGTRSNRDKTRSEDQHWKKMPSSKGTPRNSKHIICPAIGNDLLFGVSPCCLALKANRRKIIRAYIRSSLIESETNRPEIAKILTELNEKEIEIVPLHRNALDKMTKHRPHQGICMEVSRLYYTPLIEEQDMKAPGSRMPIWLALDQIIDPMNLGAVLRSSYFLGADGVIVSRKNSCSLTPVVSKASSGVMEVQPVYAVNDLAGFLQSLMGWDVVGSSSSDKQYGTELDGNDDCHVPSGGIDIQKPTILVVGNEGFGLRDDIANCCNMFLTVHPGRELHAGIDSLNVSVATGILLNLLLTKRNSQLREE